jgi:hypothetical protein
LVPLYYAHDEHTIFVSHSMLAMRGHAKDIGLPLNRILLVPAGVAVMFSGGTIKKYVCDRFAPEPIPASKAITLCSQVLMDHLVAACAPLVGKKVLCPISGGTDGIMTAIALKEAGVDVHTTCVGTSAEDFDPKWAAVYAKHLNLSYQPILLSTDNESLRRLRDVALSRIEMTDFSNVLMGMCNVLLAEEAMRWSFDVVCNADIADVALGNDTFTCAAFLKSTTKHTANNWCQYRIGHQLKNLPTNHMIFKAYFRTGVPVWQPFADRGVLNSLLGMPYTWVRPETKKPLYYEALRKYLPENSWGEDGKKVGFYTGSGIGKIRLENPLLSDSALREALANIYEEAGA